MCHRERSGFAHPLGNPRSRWIPATATAVDGERLDSREPPYTSPAPASDRPSKVSPPPAHTADTLPQQASGCISPARAQELESCFDPGQRRKRLSKRRDFLLIGSLSGTKGVRRPISAGHRYHTFCNRQVECGQRGFRTVE